MFEPNVKKAARAAMATVCSAVLSWGTATLATALPTAALWALSDTAAQAQVPDPRPAWYTADTANFRIHYREGQRPQAEAVARAAERAYGPVTQALDWKPTSRTEVLVLSDLDVANGWATPLPFNHMGIYLTPPDESELLENSDWLDLLLVHEFTHIVHLDKRRGAPRVLQNIFGRVPWFFPNAFAPTWATEGLATWHESAPEQGRGRLGNAGFEAWLRAQQAGGFISLRELNSDGRAMPTSKGYLYGAYFWEFVARTYGRQKAYAIVEQYSGNLFAPRLHSAPWGATGKMMDELWQEFLADLNQRVNARSAALRAQAEDVGQRPASDQAFAGDLLAAGPIAMLRAERTGPSGQALAVLDDGVGAASLVRLHADGTVQRLRSVNRGSRVQTGPDGQALLMQPDLCDAYLYAYDLYRIDGPQHNRLTRLTHCAHLRRAVPLSSGAGIAAIHVEAGRTRLVRLSASGGELAPLLQPPAGSTQEVLDVAAAPGGQLLYVLVRQAQAQGPALWQILQLDLAAPGLTKTLWQHNAPVSQLQAGPLGLDMLVQHQGQTNVWRLATGAAQGVPVPLTHSHTAVASHSGSAADGSRWLAVVSAKGLQLRHMRAGAQAPQATTLTQTAAASDSSTSWASAGLAGAAQASSTRDGATAASASPAAASTAASAAGANSAQSDARLSEARPYSAFSSLAPRSWFPMSFADRGLTALGASTNGQDAAGWHQYVVYGLWETSQREWLGGFQYLWRGQHSLALDRELSTRAYTGTSADPTTTIYDRRTQAQWLSLVPVAGVHGVSQRVRLGVGATLDRVQRINLPASTRAQVRDERLLGVALDVDSRATNWWAEGPNRGWQATLRAETHKPFKPDTGDAAADLTGTVVRADLKAYLPVGRGALGLRLTEARAGRGLTRPFQLGGATETPGLMGLRLNQRSLALRGYGGDEASLQGPHARLMSAEWRMPLADVDQHFMVPAVGLNRLAGTVFFDAGRAWSSATASSNRLHKSVGVELRGELKLLYSLGLDARLGVAQALDAAPGASRTRAYFSLGSFF